MSHIVKVNRRLLSSSELPPCDGPKLHAFRYRNDPIEWLELIDDRSKDANFSRQGYVFKVKIRSEIYAMKVFKFFDPNTYRWLLGPDDGLRVSEEELGFHTDPFYAECRAYARLQEAREKEGLKRSDFAECHGFMALTKKDATYLERDLGIDLWGSPLITEEYRSEAEGSPVRAIIKDLVTSDPLVDEKLLKRMLKGIRWINKHDVLIADVRLDNYKGGVLVDFGTAWTKPHCRWNPLPSHEKEDIHLVDVSQFQDIVDDLGFGEHLRSATNYEYKQKLRERKRT
ncbi:kinetochore Sim4 complex subunit FTA2-domain-containing protein [Xylaria arbuscula]|nr:kinetochore Sim4 complex subunit FTA2-domain-containing protein [Xylaria arbuscula]